MNRARRESGPTYNSLNNGVLRVGREESEARVVGWFAGRAEHPKGGCRTPPRRSFREQAARGQNRSFANDHEKEIKVHRAPL